MTFPETDPDIGFGDRQFTWHVQAMDKDGDMGHEGCNTDDACVTVGPAGPLSGPRLIS